MNLPIAIFWLIIGGTSVHTTLPYDTMDKCQQGGQEIIDKFKAKGFEQIQFICQREIIDIPAVDYLVR